MFVPRFAPTITAFMDSDERQIIEYLKTWSKHYVSAREICRRAGGKRRHREDPRWALPVLKRMVEAGLIESDSLGHYRIKLLDTRAKKRRRWISPQFAKILRDSGREFEDTITTDLDKPEDV